MNLRPPGYELLSNCPSTVFQPFPGVFSLKIGQNPKVVFSLFHPGFSGSGSDYGSGAHGIKTLFRHADHEIPLILIRCCKVDVVAAAGLLKMQDICQVRLVGRRDKEVRPGQVI